jgi:Glycosyltransferase 61
VGLNSFITTKIGQDPAKLKTSWFVEISIAARESSSSGGPSCSTSARNVVVVVVGIIMAKSRRVDVCSSSPQRLWRVLVIILLFAILFSMEENYRRTDLLLVAPFRSNQSILATNKPMTNQQQQEMKVAAATAECQAQAKAPHHDLLPIRNAHIILRLDDGAVVVNQGAGDTTTTTTTSRQQHWPVSHYLQPIIAANNNNNNNNNSSATTMTMTTTTTAGEENATAAVCAVIENHLLQHFPHAAQQLFRCWSYWRQRSDVPPVLYWKAAAQLRNASDYVITLLDVWQRDIGLTIVDGNATETTEWDVGALAMRNTDQYPFVLAAPDDAHAFRALIAPQATDWNCHTTTMPPPPPRIAILNRQIKRSLVNIQALVGALEQAFGTSTTTVPVVYFEDTTFQYQMDFMANTDIIISPHGAQLTSIIAMPECGGLLEIYPPQYYPVNFFGSLADASAILHQTLYTTGPSGNNNTVSAATVDVPYAAADYHSRVLARSARLCPNVDVVVQLTRRLVAARTQCCNIKNNAKNNVNNNAKNNANANSPLIV